MSDAQVPEKVYTKQWWTEEDFSKAGQALHDAWYEPGEGWDRADAADGVNAILAALTPTIERIRREAQVEVLKDEAEWLKTAHANSIDKGYSREYRSGFEAAQGWVRLHAQIQEESIK